MALEAGVDVELPTFKAYSGPLAQALAEGRIARATVDEAVARVLRAKFELGIFREAVRRPGRRGSAV